MAATATTRRETEAHRDGPTEAHALDELGDEIVRLAAHIHAATCRVLELVAEPDHRRRVAAPGHRGARGRALPGGRVARFR